MEAKGLNPSDSLARGKQPDVLTEYLLALREAGRNWSAINLTRNFFQKWVLATCRSEACSGKMLNAFMCGMKKTCRKPLTSRGWLGKDALSIWLYRVTDRSLVPIEGGCLELQVLACLGYFCLLRGSEAWALQLEHISLTSHSLQLTFPKLKNWPTGTVSVYKVGLLPGQVAPVFVKALGTLMARQAAARRISLFTFVSRRFCNSIISKVYPPLAQAYFSYHSWRHGRVTDLLPVLQRDGGDALRRLAGWGRWKSQASVKLYLHHSGQPAVPLPGPRFLWPPDLSL